MVFQAREGKRLVVIVGASNQPERTSGRLFFRLTDRPEFEVIPVNPRLKKLGEKTVIPSLAELELRPDIMTLYVNPKISKGMEKDILRLNPRKVIFNPGAENPELRATLERHGIATEEACSLVLLSQNAL